MFSALWKSQKLHLNENFFMLQLPLSGSWHSFLSVTNRFANLVFDVDVKLKVTYYGNIILKAP